MTFRRLFFVALLLSAFGFIANAQFAVTCRIIDNTGEGVPFATVRILNASDTTQLVDMNITRDDGTLLMPVKQAGSFVLRVNYVGMTPLEAPFSVSQEQPVADLGTLTMTDDAVALKGVEVTAQRMLVSNEIDRLSYNVQNDEESKTSTVLDMLRKVPLVTVDAQDNITVKGSSNYKIYKNGHPDPSLSQNAKEVLKAIPASMIKKIEVITEPGAKYDAEGVAAILNIITADTGSMSGATGTVSVGANSRGVLNPNAYITAQAGKLVTSINYGFGYAPKSATRQRGETLHHYTESGNELLTRSTAGGSFRGHFGNLDASYEIDQQNLLTLSFGGQFGHYSATQDAFTQMTNAAGTTLYSFNEATNLPGTDFHNYNGRLDFQHKTAIPDETLTMSYMISSTRNKQTMDHAYGETYNMPVAYSSFLQKGKENFLEHTLQFDWTRPFAEHHKIETGVKYIHRKNRSNTLMIYGGDSNLADFSNQTISKFDHLTQVAAAYASYQYQSGKWTGRAGLRYEFSYLDASYPDGSQQGFHRSLNDWVPSFSLNYQHDFFNSLKLAFATRINRPGISYLNPAVVEDPTTVSYGNAHLGSARHYSTTLTYMHLGQKFTYNISPSYAFSNGQIVGIQFVENGKTVSTYANELRSRELGISSFIQWQATGTTSFMLNANGGWNRYKSSALKLDNDGFHCFAWGQITQQLPWKLRMSFNGGFWSGGISLYAHDHPSFFYGLGLQRSFLPEERLTVRIDAQRPFSSNYMLMDNHITQGDYTGHDKHWFRSRAFGITVSYRFGSLKAHVKKTEKTIENTDMVGGSTQQTGTNGQQGQGGMGN